MNEPENLLIKQEPNIKERLNLHVKRRLQQDSDSISISPSGSPEAAAPSSSRRVAKPERKPYQKRAKTESNKSKKTGSSPGVEQEQQLEEPEQEGGSPEAAEGLKNQPSRDRYKNADILNMVLSVKKRALMQDPEVQEFWSKIMSAIKN